MEGFELLGVPLTDKEAEMVLKRFDSNRDSHLSYTDISDIFRPRNKALANEFDNRLPFELQISERLSEPARHHINRLFMTIVQVENCVE